MFQGTLRLCFVGKWLFVVFLILLSSKLLAGGETSSEENLLWLMWHLWI